MKARIGLPSESVARINARSCRLDCAGCVCMCGRLFVSVDMGACPPRTVRTYLQRVAGLRDAVNRGQKLVCPVLECMVYGERTIRPKP